MVLATGQTEGDELKDLWCHQDLHIRYMRREDLPPTVRMLKKRSVTAQVFFGPNTEAETRAYFEPIVDRMEQALAEGTAPQGPDFALLDPHTGTFMGNAALEPVPFAHGNWTLGYQLDEPFWGRGLGTLAARFLVVHALDVLGARRLTADCFATNLASARVLEKAGFCREGVQRAHYVKHGKVVDNLLFGLLVEDLPDEDVASWRGLFS